LLYCCLRPCCWHPAARLYCCLRPCCWHPAARTAAVRMLLASLLTPWTDVLLLLRCWHSPLGSLLAVSLPSAGCWHPAARTAAAGLAAGTLLLALAVGQPACCIVAFGWLVAPCYSHGRRWTRCWHPAPRALLMMPAIRGPCGLPFFFCIILFFTASLRPPLDSLLAPCC